MLATTGTWAIRVHSDNRTVYIRFFKKFICNRMKNEKHTTVGQFTIFLPHTTFSNPHTTFGPKLLKRVNFFILDIPLFGKAKIMNIMGRR